MPGTRNRGQYILFLLLHTSLLKYAIEAIIKTYVVLPSYVPATKIVLSALHVLTFDFYNECGRWAY